MTFRQQSYGVEGIIVNTSEESTTSVVEYCLVIGATQSASKDGTVKKVVEDQDFLTQPTSYYILVNTQAS